MWTESRFIFELCHRLSHGTLKRLNESPSVSSSRSRETHHKAIAQVTGRCTNFIFGTFQSTRNTCFNDVAMLWAKVKRKWRRFFLSSYLVFHFIHSFWDHLLRHTILNRHSNRYFSLCSDLLLGFTPLHSLSYTWAGIIFSLYESGGALEISKNRCDVSCS